MLRALPEAQRPVAILSYDEKPGIQAIASAGPDCLQSHTSIPPSSATTNTSGSVTLSAAVDLTTGIVHHAVTERHRSREFVAFLQKLDAAYAAGVLICILLDNHSAYRSRETRRFLATKPDRFSER